LKKVLIIDDDRLFVQMVKLYLEGTGQFKVIKAADGPMGGKMAVTENPDLIIIDIMMPGMNGFEMCQKLKSHPATKNIPVVFLSGIVEEAYVRKGMAAGADDYIKKPVEPKTLTARITKVLEKKKQTR